MAGTGRPVQYIRPGRFRRTVTVPSACSGYPPASLPETGRSVLVRKNSLSRNPHSTLTREPGRGFLPSSTSLSPMYWLPLSVRQLSESLEHRVGSRLLRMVSRSPIAPRRVGEEVAGQFLGGRGRTVADSQLLAAPLQLTQRFRNTVVRTVSRLCSI